MRFFQAVSANGAVILKKPHIASLLLVNEVVNDYSNYWPDQLLF